MALVNPLFEDSYGRLFGPQVSVGSEADGFFMAFYRRFLTDPGVAALFADTDMSRQVQMLRRSLFHLVSFYVSGEPSAELRRIAEVHRNLGVKQHMFDAWLESLIDTVGEQDPLCDETTRLAWCWAMTPGITYIRMVLLADEGASAP